MPLLSNALGHLRVGHFRLLSVLWMTLIFYLSSRSTVPMPGVFEGQDKLMHGVAYGILGVFLSRSVTGNVSAWRTILFAGLVCSFYGLTDEYHQSFVPGREVSGLDWLADTIGGFLGAYLSVRIYRAAGE